MKTKYRSPLVAAAMVALTSSFLLGCMGGSDGADPATDTQPTDSTAADSAATATTSTATATDTTVAGATGTAPAATTATTAATQTTSAAAATPQVAAQGSTATGMLVPLYTAPSDPSWAAVAAAKKAHPSVPIVAVVNPNNGPNGAPDAGYTAGISKLVAAGVKVLGYVWTSYAGRPAADVQADMARWQQFYPAVTGIFFDEMTNNAGHESYYKGLDSYAKSHGLDFTVGNPGADSSPTYVGTVDLILIYESAGLPSLSFLGGWHASHDRHNFGIIPYAVPAVDPAYVKAARDQVGYIYIQSDSMPNPWDSVPSYLDSLVAQLGS